MEIKRIVFEVFYRVWNGRMTFAKALVVPFAISVGLDLLDFLDLPQLLHIGDNVLSVAVYGWFAVTVHRLVLLGPESVPEWGLQRVTTREVVFVLSFVMISIVAMLPAILFLSLPVHSFAVASLTMLIYGYLFSRLALILPAVAVDRWVTPRESWRLSHGYQLKLIFAVFIFPVLVFIPFMLILFPLTYLLPLKVALAGIQSLTTNFMLVFTVSALSIVYREITRVEFAG